MFNTKTDDELVSKVREELYMGCVQAAEGWVDAIQDDNVQRDMRRLIRKYEGASSEFY